MSAAESTVRDDIEAAVKQISEREIADVPRGTQEKPEVDAKPVAETAQQTEARTRDEKGRFKAKADEAATAATPDPVEAPAPAAAVSPTPEAVPAPEPSTPSLAPPNGWSAEAKAKWHELPPEVMAAVQKREQDVAKFTSKTDDERAFGRDIYRTVQPYMAQIQAEGGTPVTAIQALLNTAYLLRTGSPDQKRRLLLETAQQFGVDLGSAQAQPSGQPGAIPGLETVQQRLDRLEQERAQERQAATQRLQSEIDAEVNAFAADPKHAHYEAVKGHMAALIAQGLAKDLQDAYDQAVWARPDTRATLEAERRATEEQKRRSDAKQQAEAAKRKNVGITGGPGNTATRSASEGRTLREELEANFAASIGAV